MIFAESVGSCTDIVATVIKPLLKFRPEAEVTFSTFADAHLLKMLLQQNLSFDESIRYIYFKQLEEAEVIVISKIDLMDDKSLKEMKRLIDKYSDKVTLYQNSFDTTDVRRWLKVLDKKFVSTPSSLCINYYIYGEGEARLAWHDQLLEIQSSNCKAMQAANGLIKTISQKIEFNEYPIGHLKFLLNGEKKISITHSSREEVFDNMVEERKYAGLLINARVQTSPEALSHIVSEAIKETETKFSCKIVVKSHASFQPGYPKPVYRITD